MYIFDCFNGMDFGINRMVLPQHYCAICLKVKIHWRRGMLNI